MFGSTRIAAALARAALRCAWIAAATFSSYATLLPASAQAQRTLPPAPTIAAGAGPRDAPTGTGAVASIPRAPLQLIDEPTGLAWQASEVARAGAGAATNVLGKAAGDEQGRCRTHCEAIARVWHRLASVFGTQQAGRTDPVALSLHVVQSDDVSAFSVPDGTVVLSESFVRSRHLDDAQLAFVLAHEASHVLLEHERQALTAALSLLPHNVSRTVDDVYVEFGFNIAVLKLLEPVMHQAEYEADELGLQLAALSGYEPAAQLRFMEAEVDAQAPFAAVVSTHPTATHRLDRLRAQLPLADRIFDYGTQQRNTGR